LENTSIQYFHVYFLLVATASSRAAILKFLSKGHRWPRYQMA